MPFAPRIGTWDRAAHRLSAILYRRLAENRSGRSIVSFTFDDFPKSAYRRGGEILSRYGARGTYYASFKLLGSTDATGEYFERADIEDLLGEGHELGCHTFSHRNHLLQRASLIRREFDQNEAEYRALKQSGVLRNFA